jgi:CRISPR-associated protein Cmr6
MTAGAVVTVQLAAGQLSKILERDDVTVKPKKGFKLGAGANALILLNRVVFYDHKQNAVDKKGQQALLNWAATDNLGQDDQCVAHATVRRTAALRRLREQGRTVVRLRAVPEWRLAVGLGDRANPHEIGLSLHGTYGWPVIPGSSLKGLTAAWAAQQGAGDDQLRAVFGSVRPAARGTVSFLDAIPAGQVAPVTVDVLTPHVKPYYDDPRKEVPPAEHHSPVPVSFLTVAGSFVIDLVGRDPTTVSQAADWLAEAADNLGAGAKTAAGYGYLRLDRLPEV